MNIQVISLANLPFSHMLQWSAPIESMLLAYCTIAAKHTHDPILSLQWNMIQCSDNDMRAVKLGGVFSCWCDMWSCEPKYSYNAGVQGHDSHFKSKWGQYDSNSNRLTGDDLSAEPPE